MVLERVQKIIAQSGICSRRKAETLIEEGKVSVNGKTAAIGDKADSKKDLIAVNGKPITTEKKAYYMLNKPQGYITTSDDRYGRKKVLDLVPNHPRVFAVGRLDKDSEGILILTNDGAFANRIIHPRYEIIKTYEVVLDKPFNKEDIQKFKNGIKIDRHIVKSNVRIISEKKVEIALHVGLNKVVKRLFKKMNYYVEKLTRKQIGNLKIDIPAGHYRELTEKDRNLLFEK